MRGRGHGIRVRQTDNIPKKAQFEELFINGSNFQLSKIDFKSPEIKKCLKEIEKKQEKIRKNMEIDLVELMRIQFDI